LKDSFTAAAALQNTAMMPVQQMTSQNRWLLPPVRTQEATLVKQHTVQDRHRPQSLAAKLTGW
jgi:hypothetical protein